MDGPAAPAPPADPGAGCPFDLLMADHRLFRLLAAEMEALARAAAPDPATAAAALVIVAHHLPLHQAAEEDALYPALRHGAGTDDDVAARLDALAEAHRPGRGRTAAVTALARMAAGLAASAKDRAALAAFAAAKRRHLSLEEAVLLPFARLRFSAADRAALLARLAARPLLPVVPDPGPGKVAP